MRFITLWRLQRYINRQSRKYIHGYSKSALREDSGKKVKSKNNDDWLRGIFIDLKTITNLIKNIKISHRDRFGNSAK